jgi:hypothetical protein
MSKLDWPPEFKWDSPTGELLIKLGSAVRADRRTPIVLFGSGALQLTITPSVLSADADIAPDIVPFDPKLKEFPHPLERDELTRLATAHGLGHDQKRTYLHICATEAFNPGTRWERRAAIVNRGNLQVSVPHPIDILIAKLHRYDAKDQKDFQEVISRTGFPTKEELLRELRANPRLFNKRDRSLELMPSQFGDSKITENVPKVFRDLWKTHVSVKRDIIAPANEAIESSYRHGTHKSGLDDLAATPLNSEKPEDPDRGSPIDDAHALLKKKSQGNQK